MDEFGEFFLKIFCILDTGETCFLENEKNEVNKLRREAAVRPLYASVLSEKRSTVGTLGSKQLIVIRGS